MLALRNLLLEVLTVLLATAAVHALGQTLQWDCSPSH